MAAIGHFPDVLQCIWLPDPNHSDNRYVQLTGPFAFIRPSGEVIDVPKGFVSDGSSVPHVLWSGVEPAFGDCLEAAIIHDFIYSHHGDVPGRRFTRAEADTVFLEGMTALGVPLLERRLMWLGVRAGGWTGWGR